MPTIKEVHVPDMGSASTVDVIEILVKPGDTVAKDDSLITLESEKASMDVPSPYAGVIKEVKVKVGDKISEGALIVTLESEEAPQTQEKKPEVSKQEAPKSEAPKPAVSSEKAQEPKAVSKEISAPSASDENDEAHAGPGVRRLARELDIDLSQIAGSGNKGRVLKEDLQALVKTGMGQSSTVGTVAAAPSVDFSKFGEIEVQPLSKIKRFTGVNVHRSWVSIPHVTQFDEADITNLEEFRHASKEKAEKQGYKLTPIVFILKAVVAALRKFPTFNASLDGSGANLVLKKYFHIGVAVDTPQGLVVPVIRDVDKKGLFELAQELSNISSKARDKGLTPAEMQGSCFTISSLGGIGGTAFTPIVNGPDVGILGVSKAVMKPVFQDGEFVPRLMLPLSLSYDHRVIDGAEGARFIVYLSELLGDIRLLLM